MGGLVQLLPILLIIGVFYILLIRPQQKRQRELQETISQLKAGDRIVTNWRNHWHHYHGARYKLPY